jgi:hypothetical protein
MGLQSINNDFLSGCFPYARITLQQKQTALNVDFMTKFALSLSNDKISKPQLLKNISHFVKKGSDEHAANDSGPVKEE